MFVELHGFGGDGLELGNSLVRLVGQAELVGLWVGFGSNLHLGGFGGI